MIDLSSIGCTCKTTVSRWPRIIKKNSNSKTPVILPMTATPTYRFWATSAIRRNTRPHLLFPRQRTVGTIHVFRYTEKPVCRTPAGARCLPGYQHEDRGRSLSLSHIVSRLAEVDLPDASSSTGSET